MLVCTYMCLFFLWMHWHTNQTMRYFFYLALWNVVVAGPLYVLYDCEVRTNAQLEFSSAMHVLCMRTECVYCVRTARACTDGTCVYRWHVCVPTASVCTDGGSVLRRGRAAPHGHVERSRRQDGPLAGCAWARGNGTLPARALHAQPLRPARVRLQLVSGTRRTAHYMRSLSDLLESDYNWWVAHAARRTTCAAFPTCSSQTTTGEWRTPHGALHA